MLPVAQCQKAILFFQICLCKLRSECSLSLCIHHDQKQFLYGRFKISFVDAVQFYHICLGVAFFFLLDICYASCICGFVSFISFQPLSLFCSLFAMQLVMNLIFSFQASNFQTSPSCCPSTPTPLFFVAYSGKSFPTCLSFSQVSFLFNFSFAFFTSTMNFFLQFY